MDIDEVSPVNKDSIVLGDHPGPINSEREVMALGCDTEKKVLVTSQDYFGSFYLKDGKKEDVDFKVVDEQVWEILYNKYGGKELRRKSIAVPTEIPDRPDYVVEI